MALGLLVSAAVAQASIVKLDFGGTYDTQGNVLFGQTGAAVAYHYSITYDTALNTNTNVIHAGQAVGPYTAGSALYGYSKSGVVAASLSFGTQTWTVANLSSRVIAAGVDADLWFNTDISLAVPATAWMYFESGGNTLALGQGSLTAAGLVLGDTSSVAGRGGYYDTIVDARGTMDISAVPEASVPEPGTLALAAFGLLASRVRRQREPSPTSNCPRA